MHTENKEQKLFTKAFLMVCIMSLFLRIAIQMQATSMPLYMQYLGSSMSNAGLSTTLSMFAAFLVRPFTGIILDRYGRKWLLIIGMLLFCAVTFGYTMTTTVLMLLTLRTIGGIASAIYTTASGTMASDIIPEAEMGRGIGLFSLAIPIAQAFSPTIALAFIGNDNNFNLVFMANIVIVIIAIVLTVGMGYKEPDTIGKKEIEVQGKSSKQNVFSNMFEKGALPAAMPYIFIVFGSAGLGVFLPTYAKSLGIENIGIFYTVQAVVILTVRLLSGKVTSRVGYAPPLVVSFVVLTLSMVALGFATKLWEFLAIAAFIGIGNGLSQPLLNAAAIINSDKFRRGSANATFFAAFDIGFGSGAYIMGLFADALGIPGMFFVGAGFTVLSIPVYFAMLHKHVRHLR